MYVTQVRVGVVVGPEVSGCADGCFRLGEGDTRELGNVHRPAG